MSTSSAPDLAAAGSGVSTSKFRLLRPFSMTPHPTPLSSPTMRPSSSRSEKLLKDALLRDERERLQLSTPHTHRRRHSHVPTSLYSASTSTTREDYSNELRRNRDNSPVGRILFSGNDVKSPQFQPQYQQSQQAPHQYYTRRSSPSQSPSPSRRSSASTSPSPSPLQMRRRHGGLGLTTPNNTNTTPIRQPQPQSHLQGHGEPFHMTPHEQVLRTRLERALIVNGRPGRDGMSGDENEVRDEQGGWPWRRGRLNTGGSVSGSIISTSFNTVITTSSSAASNSNSNSSQSHSQSNYPHTPQTQTRTYYPTSTPNRTAQSNNQRSPYYSPSSPYSLSVPAGAAGGMPEGHSPSHTRSRSRTDPNPPLSHPNPNLKSPRKNSTPTKSPLPVTSSPSVSGKLTRSNSKSTKKSPLPLSLGNARNGEAEGELRLPTPPPTPPFIARNYSGNGGIADGTRYVPSPYKTVTANASPSFSGSGTPTKKPARIQTQTHIQRKKEAGLEMRRPTQGPAATRGCKEKGKEPLRPLDCSSASSRQQGGQRQRDVTITPQSQARLSTTTGPNPLPDSKKSNNNTDRQSLASTESCSTTSSASHSHVECALGYCACSSHSSLDGPAQPQTPFINDVFHHTHHLVQSQPNPPSPSSSPTTKPFNARKASTQCRAIQGYVSFASVEGLGEPPLVGDEFDGGDGFGEADGGRGGKGNGVKGTGLFLPLGVWNAALGWKRLLDSVGVGHAEEQGVVV